jgi:secretion/DNA translocation related TadE-like protein
VKVVGRVPAQRDRGSATVWLLCVCGLVWSVMVAALLVGSAIVARHRAAAVADLAALAAAAAQSRGDPGVCRAAAHVAAAQGGRLDWCRVEAGSVLVVAEVGVGWRVINLPPARARARAGGSGVGQLVVSR